MKVVRARRPSCIAAFLLLFSCALSAQTLDAHRIDRLVAKTLRLWNVPGAAVAITSGDHVLYLKGFGVREAGSDLPITPDTRFAIGSTTKAFTSAAIGMLVDEGKMSWDESVRKHLEYFHLADPLADEEVTVRDILSHRTGLSRHDLLWYGSPWSRKEIIRRIGRVKLSRPFRTTYQYQNIMFTAAGEALAHAAGTTWEEFIRNRIFEPLGMKNTDCSVTQCLHSSNHATPHVDTPTGPEPVAWRNVDNIGGAGAINSTARDLARWMQFQLNGGVIDGKRLISVHSLEETRTPQIVVRLDEHMRMLTDEMTQLSYGMGWFINDYRGHPVVSHGGAIDGFRANVTLLPKDHVGIAILTNLGQMNVPEALRDGIVDILFDLPPVDWNKRYLDRANEEEGEQRYRLKQFVEKRFPGTKPSRELSAYVGEYSDPAYGTVKVSLEDGELVFAWSNFKTPLDHRYFDTFLTGSSDLGRNPAVFHLNGEGEVETLNVLDVEFHRVEHPVVHVAGN